LYFVYACYNPFSTFLCNSSQTPTVIEIRAGLKEFIRGKKNSEPVKSEIDEYLSEALDDVAVEDVFDILSWWKLKSPRFPMLARLARDILAVPISTVASLSAFSTGRRTLSSVRSCLNDESIEALICAQDWLRVSVAGYIFYFLYFHLFYYNCLNLMHASIASNAETRGDVGASLWSFEVDDSSL
jgi:hypothetical protein